MGSTRGSPGSDAPASGALVVDKPSGPTSHDIVQQARRLWKTKVGHTGTLDPQATGVLTLLLGRGTRLSRFLQSSDKEYEATIRLGSTTDTFDAEGTVQGESEIPPISSRQAQATLQAFTGEIRQQVPAFSAVKVSGQKLYRLARRKQPVELPWRTVRIHRLELQEQKFDCWRLHIHCSAGTYIRTLAHDIGQALGCGAHLEGLRRTRSGLFELRRAVPAAELATRWQDGFYRLEELLPEFPRIDLDSRQWLRVQHGNRIKLALPGSGHYCRLFYQGQLMALGEAENRGIHPAVVLYPA